MLADEPVLTHCLLTLDETGKCLCVAFNEPWIHKPLTAALLQPQPCFTENLIRAERLSVPLSRRQELARRWHLLAVEVGSIHKICAVQFRHGELHDVRCSPARDFICEWFRFIARPDAPSTAICSVPRHLFAPFL